MKKQVRRQAARERKYLLGCNCYHCQKIIERKRANSLRPYKRERFEIMEYTATSTTLPSDWNLSIQPDSAPEDRIRFGNNRIHIDMTGFSKKKRRKVNKVMDKLLKVIQEKE